MSLSTHRTVPTWVRSGGPFLVSLLGTSLAFLVAGLFPHGVTLMLLAPALVLGAGVIAAQIRQTALLSVVLGSLLASGVVCALILWDTVTGSLSSNFYPWVVAGEIVGVGGVLMTVAVGFTLGTLLARPRT